MRKRRVPRAWLRGLIAALLVTWVGGSASAQGVGDPILPLDIRTLGTEVYIGFDSDYVQYVRAEQLGGVTLFASFSPAGPVIARMAFPPPFSITLEGVPGIVIPNVPPGTYYVTAVYGLVAAPSVVAADWREVVVLAGTPCTVPPGAAFLSNESLGPGSTVVRLFFSSHRRCATSYLLEAGSAPGLADLANFERASQVLVSSTVPPGRYYLRIRGKNVFGIGPYSELIPVSVPDCSAMAPGVATDLAAQVTGNTVTLSWTSTAPPGLPVTFREAILQHLGSPPPIVLIPGGGTSITASVPSGAYSVSIALGNGCGKSYSSPVSFTVP